MSKPFASIDVVGLGLTSPAGFSVSDNVFFARARVTQPMPSPFLNEDDEPIPFMYCPWLEPTLSVAQRMDQLAFTAVAEVMEDRAAQFPRLDLCMVGPTPMPEFTEKHADDLAVQLKRAVDATTVTRHSGAAGAYRALQEASTRLHAGACDAVCLLGVDSGFRESRVYQGYRRRSSQWIELEPPCSEGAGAVLLTARTDRSVPRLAKVLGSLTTRGTSCDYNDEVVDGVALTYLIRQLPNRGGVPVVFGPSRSDALRQREFRLASARTHTHFGSPYRFEDLESEVGRLGAAAGVMHLAYGVACDKYRAIDPALQRGSPFYTWAISDDGTRGAAILEGATG